MVVVDVKVVVETVDVLVDFVVGVVVKSESRPGVVVEIFETVDVLIADVDVETEEVLVARVEVVVETVEVLVDIVEDVVERVDVLVDTVKVEVGLVDVLVDKIDVVDFGP